MRLVPIEAYPRESLLARCREQGAYTDCYQVVVDRPVSLPEFVTAFYTTPLFKLERLILDWLVSRPSSDEEARQLGLAEIDRFAAWIVEARIDRQLLMADMSGATKSWLMAEPERTAADAPVSLYFGSAIMRRRKGPGDKPRMALFFRMLLPFHRLYSRALLWSAKRRLEA